MQNESVSNWDEVKDSVLNDKSRLESIRLALITRSSLGEADCTYLNLLLSADQARRSTMVSDAMVRWSRALALLTGVLSIAALADVLLRLF